MANFQVQVEGMTGLSVGSNPTTAQLTEFLKEGAYDVTNKSLLSNPQDAKLFTRVSGEVTSNGTEKVDRAHITEVIREAGVNNDWRPCQYIRPALQSRVTDTSSIHYTSKYNPSYTVMEDGTISVFPVPGATTDAFKVYYINNNMRDTDDNGLAYNSTGIAFFPKSRVYLVIMYASIRTLQSRMATIAKPGVAGDATELTSVSDLSSDNTIDVLGDQSEYDQWWSTTGHLIEDEEDPELGAIQVQKISQYINAFQAQLGGNKTEYEWMNARMMLLAQQYNSVFGQALEEKKA